MMLFAKFAMVLSWAYYALVLGFVWLGQLFGLHNLIWEVFDFPKQEVTPPLWVLIIGASVSVLALFSLWTAYLGGWRILNGGPSQDFRYLSRHLRKLAWGLIGFWFGYNVLSGAVPLLLVVDLSTTEGFEFGWDPLDIDIVFAITGIVLLAISRTLERAWIAEDEVKHFL